MFKNLKRNISLFMSISMCAALCTSGSSTYVNAARSGGGHSSSPQSTTAAVQTSTQSTNSSEPFTLTTSSSTWQGGFSANIQLNSFVDGNITDWALTLNNIDFDITNIWCASAEKSNDTYIITPQNWNQNIYSGQYVNFGFGATGTLPETIKFSVTYTVNGTQYTYNSNETSESIAPSAETTSEPVESTTPSETVSTEPAESTTPSETVSTEPSQSITTSETIPSVEPTKSAETVVSEEPVQTTDAASPSPSASSEELINAPLSNFNRTMPSTGDVHALIIMIQFKDVTFSNGMTADELEDAVFGEENTSSSNYPLESSSAFYERSSYGNLNLTGDVFTYTATNNRSYYNNKNEYETLVMEAMKALDSQIDYSDYDNNGDGYLDCFSINVPTNGSSDDDFWYGCQATWYLNNSFKLDNEKVKGYVVNDEQPTASGIYWYNATYCHELGHLMGLPDYYKYNSTDWQGMNGDAGYERMDDSIGDFSSFSKLMLGWLSTNEVQVYDTSASSETFELSSMSDTGSCVILPIGDLDDNYFSEYFLIEYVTPSNNYDTAYFNTSGIRILHVNANTGSDPYSNSGYKAFLYENYGSEYDTSDNAERVLKLVNDGNGFYKTGSTITYGTSNFAGYDTSGAQTIDTGYSISIGNLSGGNYSVTVTK